MLNTSVETMHVEDQTQELWNIYDEYRISCMNQKYYGRKLKTIRCCSIALDLIVASSTTLAAVKVLGDNYQPFLQWLAAASAIGALMKTTFGLDKTITKYTRLHTTYHGLTEKYRRLTNEIKVTRGVNSELRDRAKALLAQTDDISAEEEVAPSKRKLLKIQKEVEIEIPSASLYWPRCDPARLAQLQAAAPP